MYDNIGGKIQGLAKASFIVVAIAEVITGIALMATDDDLTLYGLLVMFVGPIVAWVSSWLLYGFGQLIENSDIIAAHSHTIANFSKATADFCQDNSRNSYLIVEALNRSNQNQE